MIKYPKPYEIDLILHFKKPQPLCGENEIEFKLTESDLKKIPRIWKMFIQKKEELHRENKNSAKLEMEHRKWQRGLEASFERSRIEAIEREEEKRRMWPDT